VLCIIATLYNYKKLMYLVNVGSWPTCSPPGHPGTSLQSSFPACQPLTCIDAWGYSCPGARAYTSSCNRFLHPPLSRLAEWQYSLLVCQPLLPVLCHQQTCWQCTDRWGTPLDTSLQLDSVPLTTTLWLLTFSQFTVHLTTQLSRPQIIP